MKPRRINPFYKIEPWLRIRHYRGHGVHSPIAYGYIREVMMKREDMAVRIRETANYFGCKGIVTDPAEGYGNEGDLLVITPDNGSEKILSLPPEAAGASVICITSPRKGRDGWLACLEAIDRHEGLSLDCRDLILFIYGRAYSKQHIRL